MSLKEDNLLQDTFVRGWTIVEDLSKQVVAFPQLSPTGLDSNVLSSYVPGYNLENIFMTFTVKENVTL